jgi:CheY-like chemotaxis protein
VRGKVELQVQWLDLREPVQRAWETAQPVLDAHGKSVHPRLPMDPVWVDGDMVRLSQVVANLLTNAAKYSGPNAEIFLDLRAEDGRAVVSVRDTGAGIPAELLPRVFDLFVQGDRTAERAQGGLGIGLTLVKRLVDMHGGSVHAHSGGPGEGSAFVLDLPLAATGEAVAAEPEQDATIAPARGRVLVVDDNVDACESIAMILDAFGYEVQCLHDGASVLPHAAQWQPHAIVLDIGLPGLSGLQVAMLLREHPGFRSTPLIALTGYGQQQDQQRSRHAGFDLHLTKPVDPQRLLHSLAELMAANA